MSVMDGRPVVDAFGDSWRRVVTEPRGFFADMPQTGGLGEPTTFLAVCALANAVGHLIVGWGLRAALGIFVGHVLGALVAAAALVLVAQHLFDGRAGFEPTFRVVAYAAAPLVVLWVPLLGAVARLYAAFLIVRGLEQVNGFDTTRAVLTVLLGLGALLALGSLHAGSVWF